MYEPQHLEPWKDFQPTGFDSPQNYMGERFPEFYLAPCSRNRDSDTLQESNFRVIERDLMQYDNKSAPVENHRFGHWACGWYELILIHKDNEKALTAADDWAAALSDYPAADESDWSELQVETASEVWQNMSISDRIDFCKRFNVSIFAARQDYIPETPQGGEFDYLADGC